MPRACAPEGWSPFGAYGDSKLSNVLHAAEAARRWAPDGIGAFAVNTYLLTYLLRRWAPDGIGAFAVHPGIVPTALGRQRGEPSHLGAALHNLGVWLWWHVIARPVAERVEQGAASVVFAALSPGLSRRPFGYIKHCQLAEPAAHALNASAAAFLWRESERLVRHSTP